MERRATYEDVEPVPWWVVGLIGGLGVMELIWLAVKLRPRPLAAGPARIRQMEKATECGGLPVIHPAGGAAGRSPRSASPDYSPPAGPRCRALPSRPRGAKPGCSRFACGAAASKRTPGPHAAQCRLLHSAAGRRRWLPTSSQRGFCFSGTCSGSASTGAPGAAYAVAWTVCPFQNSTSCWIS